MKIKYIVANALGETVEYGFNNPLKSRAEAFKFIRSIPANESGFKLLYSIDGIETIELLAAKCMSTAQFMESLANECEILANLDLPDEIQVCYTSYSGMSYMTVAENLLFGFEYSVI